MEERKYGFCQECSWTWLPKWREDWEKCPHCGSYHTTFHTKEEIENA